MPVHVPGNGPYTAPLLFVGEGPGRTEELKGRPFVGVTGSFVRGCVRRAGLDPDEVRWNNAIPVRCNIPTDAGSRRRLIEKWWDHLRPDLQRVDARGIVACGAVAWQRLKMEYGLDGPGAITLAHGGVYEIGDGRIIVPCLHPAGVMRGKIQAERLSIERAITRAVGYATGTAEYAPTVPHVVEDPRAEEVECALNTAKVVCVDTEFVPDEHRTTMVGFTTDAVGGRTVWSIGRRTFTGPEWGGVQRVLQRAFGRRDLVKVAHHHFADVEALGWLGIDSWEPWFDTLYVFAALYPGLPTGLSHVARFYLDDVRDWKGMDKEDPVYNALDVAYTWRVYEHEREDITDAGMWDLVEEEILPSLPVLYGMQQRGLRVDGVALNEMRKENAQEITRLRVQISRSADGIFSRRTGAAEGEIARLEGEIDGIVEQLGVAVGERCEMHPSYDGRRKKRFTTNKQCTCSMVYFSSAGRDAREAIASRRKEITKWRTKLKKWTATGFNPGNNDHLRWLLYDKAALGLRVQKNRETGSPTANATAIAKLLALKSTRAIEGAPELLTDIKRVQHLEKENSTFLDPPMDEEGVVHPQYRMVTGTGRPASGDDAFLAEKGVVGAKYNVLNIPEKARRIYVPYGDGHESGHEVTQTLRGNAHPHHTSLRREAEAGADGVLVVARDTVKRVRKADGARAPTERGVQTRVETGAPSRVRVVRRGHPPKGTRTT
jgi:DNA polymerase